MQKITYFLASPLTVNLHRSMSHSRASSDLLRTDWLYEITYSIRTSIRVWTVVDEKNRIILHLFCVSNKEEKKKNYSFETL